MISMAMSMISDFRFHYFSEKKHSYDIFERTDYENDFIDHDDHNE